MFKRTSTVIAISFIFLMLVLANYFINLYILKSAINDLQKHSIKNASEHIIQWLGRKIDAVQTVQSLIIGKDHIQDKRSLHNIIKYSSPVANFAYMFIGYGDNITISSRFWDEPLVYATVSRPWYQETINNDCTTITKPYLSSMLNVLVVSVCTPTKDIKGEKGVLCGILPLKDIENEILNISLPYNGKAFLLDEHQKILIHHDNKELYKVFPHKLDNDLMSDTYSSKTHIFSQGYIDYAKWYLVAQLDKDKVYEKVNFQLFINFIIYTISVIVFIWLNLFYNRNQKKSDINLKRAQALLQSFMKSDERGFLIADINHNITYYNNQFVTLLNIYEKKLDKIKLIESITHFETIPLWIKDCLTEMINATIEKEKTYTNTFTFSQNQKSLSLFFTSIPVKNIKGEYNGTIFIVNDVTKTTLEKKLKKEQEDILFQQSKMADLGEMIGAISHQWRQPLNALSLLLGNLLQFKDMGCLDDKTFKENIEHALSNTHYLASTIDTFRNFYRPNKKIQSFDIVDTINQTIFILEPYFKNSSIQITIDDEIGRYICYNYKNEFQQIIANLLINAKDALFEKNHMNKYIKLFIHETKNKYEIKIEDNGSGINTQIKETLFSPFSTSKGEKGTGNGLYLSRLIARKKLAGDLILFCRKNPTTFLLSMQKQLKENT